MNSNDTLITKPHSVLLVQAALVHSQSPGSDHEDGPHEGGHDLQEGGWEMAEQVGDSEHEERDGEEHDAPNYDEADVSTRSQLNRERCLT